MTDTPSEQWLTDVRDEAAARLTRIAQVQDELATLYAEARTAEGRVRVRVNAAGRPTALTLEPRATSMPASALAAAILRAVDEAATHAGERLAELVGSLVPAAELDAMLTGRPTQADRLAVRAELDALSAG
ncbi:YbaB/EbfC family nucleoid-associated protein [Nocardioides sp.]|uniref:YbaB/EbfC family nucleoid-associated protein n=1 Tax=Nocardioides sp. TaxID=35761 RepID=UPI00286E4294|nr:YbaB/EbfC family nucleoid-associated protein [Nocardioides sp.]